MGDLILCGVPANRPLFSFESKPLAAIPTEQLTLSTPSEKLDAAHWPVRGDLAHIRLAGRCFVPHYAVPMPHGVTATAVLRRAGKADAEALCEIAVGQTFNVLDMTGSWAWGQAGEDGFVGYLPLDVLAAL